MINTKAIKNRIQSVTNTKKITKAMEMVSASKMRKSVEAVLNTRTYATMTRDLMINLSGVENRAKYALLTVRPVKNILLIIISSNRGLCGSFNANIARKAIVALKNKKELAKHFENGKEILPDGEVNVKILGIGKKSASVAKREGHELVGMFEDINGITDFDKIVSISKDVIRDFKESKYDKVVVAYTDYKSSLTQEPKIRQLLPVSAYELDKMLDELGRDSKSVSGQAKEGVKDSTNLFDASSYIFEPNQDEILEYVLPKLVEVQMLQSVLESSASEHSSRMMAMRNASDAARDMIDELNLTFNKARQASITQEIAEIAGGAAALE
ncbi:MAG: ATP synthase F1 subunit gamma [bacterium]|nr:ATP synthase F1 subunit gamma [bacterium]